MAHRVGLQVQTATKLERSRLLTGRCVSSLMMRVSLVIACAYFQDSIGMKGEKVARMSSIVSFPRMLACP